MKEDIYTVIIESPIENEPTTASFYTRSSAHAYVAEEVQNEGDDIDIEDLLDELDDQDYYESPNGVKYFVEEAKLIDDDEYYEQDQDTY